jgi:SpoVK/Ycf46/Vps4 family AAA+-type ATPase
VPRPDAAGRERIFRVHLQGKPAAADVDAGELARLTDGMTGADIQLVCQRAALLAVRDFIHAPGANKDPASLQVGKDKLLAAIQEHAGARKDRSWRSS